VRVWKVAPETRGKTMRQIVHVDAERYRERRRRDGAPGAKRRRDAASRSTINKELRFACSVYYDFLDQLDEVTDEHKRGPVPPNPSRRCGAAGRSCTTQSPRAALATWAAKATMRWLASSMPFRTRCETKGVRGRVERRGPRTDVRVDVGPRCGLRGEAGALAPARAQHAAL